MIKVLSKVFVITSLTLIVARLIQTKQVDFSKILSKIKGFNNKKKQRKTLFKPPSLTEKQETFDLRYKLIGKKIDVTEAKRILFVHDGTYQDVIINELNNDSTEIYYIINAGQEQNREFSEFVVFRHKNKNHVAFYKIIPFTFSGLGDGYTVLSETNFWNHFDFNNILYEKYIRYRAIRTIKKHCGTAAVRWIFGGVLNDSTFGIRASLDYIELKKLAVFES